MTRRRASVNIVTMPTHRPAAPPLLFEALQRYQAGLRSALHDTLAQTLGGTGLMVRVLARRAIQGVPAGATELQEVEAALERAAAETRQLTESLQPITEEPGSLAQALGRLAERAAQTLSVRSSLSAEVALSSPGAGEALFLLAHEAVQNVLRHARASHLVLELRDTDPGLELRVQDDGCGLPQPSRQPGRGLALMRACARAAGGRLQLKSRLGEGMLVGCGTGTR